MRTKTKEGKYYTTTDRWVTLTSTVAHARLVCVGDYGLSLNITLNEKRLFIPVFLRAQNNIREMIKTVGLSDITLPF